MKKKIDMSKKFKQEITPADLQQQYKSIASLKKMAPIPIKMEYALQ